MYKNWKKIVCFIFIICLSLTALIGCKTEYNWGPYPENDSGVVSGQVVGQNGGMAVQKGEYLYFINGLDENDLRSNEFGEVIKGSICRRPIRDTDNQRVKVIVPKVVYTGYTEGGFFIYGDWIYYATANTERGSSGVVQSHIVDFMKVRIDGTGNERIEKVDPSVNESGNIPFKFIEAKDGNVYLVYFYENSLYKVNATSNSSSTLISDNVTSYLFGEDGVFYAQKQVRKNAQEQEIEEDFNHVYSSNLVDQAKSLTATLSGMTGEESESHFKYTLKSLQRGILFYTREYLVGGVNADKGLWGFNIATEGIKPFTLNFNDTTFLAVGWNEGIVAFNGTAFVRFGNTTSADEFKGPSYNMYFPENTTITLYFLEGDDIYYGVSDTSAVSGVQIWRFDITIAEEGKPMLASAAERLTLSTVRGEWLKPKVLDGKLFFVNTNTLRDKNGNEVIDEYAELGYKNYTYYIDLADLPDAEAKKLQDELVKEVFIGKHDASEETEE